VSFRHSRLALAGIFVALAAVYIVEALLHHSPWIFFDELDYATNAQRIAELGTPPGGKPFHFDGLYPFMIAPAWLADSVHTAYWASKTIGVLVMTAAVFPAYWLARILAAPRPVALFTAAATVAVPALSFSSSLMTETLAYPYAVLCFALVVKALSAPSRAWIVAASAAVIVAPVVRKELAVIPAAAAVAALAFVAVPWLDGSWKRWCLAAVGTAAALALLGWALRHVSTTWSVAIENPRAMISYARSGAASIVIGLAVLPALAGLAALVRPRREPSSPARRAFVCLFVSATAGFLLYTAAKGVYFGPLSNPIEERNLIYLVPLLLAATAVWLSRRAVEPLALAAATAIVLWLVVTVPLHFGGTPASDAPSLEALGGLGLSGSALNGLLAGVTVLAAVIVLQRGVAVIAGACALVLAWSLGSEIYASHRSADYAAQLARTIPRPFEWIDEATGGRSAVYVGQKILQPTDIWLQSFWNRSLVQMRTLDGTPGASGPLRSYNGIPASGDILLVKPRRDGALPVPGGVDFLVADQGITGSGPEVGEGERWRAYQGTRLRSAAIGVYTDGWMGARSTFHVYDGNPRTLHLTVSRAGACSIPGNWHVTASIGGNVRARGTGEQCKTLTLDVPAPPPAFTLVTTVEPTFVPAELIQGSSDTRDLGATIVYG